MNPMTDIKNIVRYVEIKYRRRICRICRTRDFSAQ